MAPNIDPAITSIIVAAVVFRPEGVVLNEIVTAFPTPQDRPKVQRWVDAVVAAGLVEKDPTVTPHRFYPRAATADYYRRWLATKEQRPTIKDQGPGTKDQGPDSRDQRPGTKDQGLTIKDQGPGAKDLPEQTPAAADLSTGFAAQMEPLVRDIVVHIMVRASAVAFLQQAAAAVPEAQRAAFVQYGLDRLSHLTLGECARMGLEPAQYEIWRRQYFPPAQASTPKAADLAPETDESKKSPTSGANGTAGGAPTRSKGRSMPGPDPVDEVLTPILNAVTRTSASGSATSFPAGSSRVQAGIPAPELRAATKGFIDLLGRLAPGGVSPTVRVLLGVAVAPVLGWLLYLVSSSPLLGGLLGTAVVAGLMLWPRHSAGSSNGAGAPQPAAVTDRGYNPGAPTAAKPRWPWILAASGVALVLTGVAVAVIWYQRNVQRPPEAALRDYLVASAAPLPVRVIGVDVTYGKADATGCPITYQALFETTEPLYRRLDATEYLRAHGQMPVSISDLKFQISEVGPAPKPALQDLVLVTTQTPPGATTVARGTLIAWRRNGAWVFTGNPMQLERAVLAGEPKPAGALAVDLPGDAAKLSAIVAEHVAYAGKVQAAAAAAAATRERERQERAGALGQLLRAGTMFVGAVTDPFRGGNQSVVVEVTSSSPATQKLTAVLRNDGGWSDTRAFSGDWTLAPDADGAVVMLRTVRGDALDGAGPLLQDRFDWSLSFQLNADGSVTATAGQPAIHTPQATAANGLRRVDPADAAGVKADVLRPLAPAIAATQAGAVYRGTVTSRVYRTSEVLLLRFSAAEDGQVSPSRGLQTGSGSDPRTAAEALPGTDSLSVRATVESTTVGGGVRPFRGVIVSNLYRAGTSPIRLRSADAERVARANAWSLLGFDSTNNGLELALRVAGDRLVGEDARFTYEFANAYADGGTGNAEPPAIGDAGGAAADPLADTAALEPGIAYARIAGRWVALPHNNGHELKKVVQIINGWFDKLKAAEAKLAGKAPEASKDIVGELVFDGTDPVPVLPGADVLIVYVGGITPRSQKEIAAYPILLLEPPIELSPMQTLPTRERYTLLSELVPGVRNFGPRRVEVTIEQPRPTLTVARPRAPLTPGPYAVECNGQVFEFLVQ